MHIDTQLLALVCGHCLGDPVLEADGLDERKSAHRRWVLYHAIVVAAITWVFLGNLKAWWIAGLQSTMPSDSPEKPT